MIVWSCIVLGCIGGVLSAAIIVCRRFLADYGLCAIDVNSGGRTLDVAGGQTLLEALRSAEVFLPSGCGSRASCGLCKVRLTDGGGAVLATERPLLTQGDIRGGIRLACQVRIRGPIAIELPPDLLAVRLYRARLESAGMLTHDTRRLTFALDEPLEFHPGQYVQASIPTPDGPVFRAYSISGSSADKKRIELIVRLVAGGAGSTYLHRLAVGGQMDFAGPYGQFRLSDDPESELICVAGGCGLAPVKCIVEHLLSARPQARCRLFVGAKDSRDVMLMGFFGGLAGRHPDFSYVYSLSNPRAGPADWAGRTGMIHHAVAHELAPGGGRQAFICGPEPMIAAVTRVLIEKGLSRADIYADRFEAARTWTPAG
ncbi:MAG: 2Fe-2S iron-sulfur cluster binding domain-containing protein [Planctomycetes bacterium]|nr:2Fe-2S iron-sulfur cluster binding domain-containing protein [Planctomycetota bacterium]